MGLFNNFESWAKGGDGGKKDKRGGKMDRWARPQQRPFNQPSRNPLADVNDEAVNNPYSDYHGYNSRTDDVDDDY